LYSHPIQTLTRIWTFCKKLNMLKQRKVIGSLL